jgi:hypothetical protein
MEDVHMLAIDEWVYSRIIKTYIIDRYKFRVNKNKNIDSNITEKYIMVKGLEVNNLKIEHQN